jgi:hypothetical protein
MLPTLLVGVAAVCTVQTQDSRRGYLSLLFSWWVQVCVVQESGDGLRACAAALAYHRGQFAAWLCVTVGLDSGLMGPGAYMCLELLL